MEAYDGRQIVGMDLHRHRSVLVRMTEDGRRLNTRNHQQPGSTAQGDRPGRGDPEGCPGGYVWVVLGC